MYDKNFYEGLKLIKRGIETILSTEDEHKSQGSAVTVDVPTAPPVEETKPAPKKPNVSFSKEDLDSMAYNDLKKLAKDLGKSGAGAREAIIARILDVDLNADADGDVSAKEENTTESKSVKTGGLKKTAKIAKKAEPKEEVEVDPVYAKVLEATEELSVEDMADLLQSIGVSPKGNREALLDKVYNAVKEGKISLDDEDEEADTEEATAVTEPDEDSTNEDEDDGVNDPDNMTDARREACESYEEEIENDVNNGEISMEDIKEFLVEFYGEESKDDIDKQENTDLVYLYIDAVKRMINDDGELIEEGAYEVNGVPFCCGRPLQYAEDTGKYICEMCGTEYDAE